MLSRKTIDRLCFDINDKISHGRDRFVIYPFGDVGVEIKRIIDEEIPDAQIFCILDDVKSKKQSGIHPISYIKEMGNEQLTYI